MRSALLAILFSVGLAAGCSRSADEAEPPLEAPPSTWSRDALAEAGDAGLDASAALGVAGPVEPGALDEILAKTPKGQPSSTAEEGRTAIGTETGEKEDRSKKKAPLVETAAPTAPKKPRVSVGSMSIQGDMSTPSIERAARAQLYWPLVQRCRDKEGKILPPDAILLLFRIDDDGYIIGSSISATPSKPAFEDAAHCMRRELSAATFRAPAAARGMFTSVNMTVPSVD